MQSFTESLKTLTQSLEHSGLDPWKALDPPQRGLGLGLGVGWGEVGRGGAASGGVGLHGAGWGPLLLPT